MAYTIGSAFYGIYFIISFPVFYRLDEKILIDENGKKIDEKPYTVYQTVMEAMGSREERG
jgi:cycloeucalenol cycloisomerase